MQPAQITEPLIEWLRKASLFRELPPEDVYAIATLMQERTYPANTMIIRQGLAPEFFAIMRSGKADVMQLRLGKAQPERVNVKLPGDYFCEAELLSGRPLQASVLTSEPSVLFIIPAVQFQQLLSRYPLMRQIIALADYTYRLSERRNFQDWLQPNENVIIVLNKHWSWLIQAGWFPIFIGPLAVLVMHVLWWYVIPFSWFLVVMPVVVVFCLWLVYVWLDFTDDTYVITNRRVIAAERVQLLNDKRVEAPLASIRSVEITQSQVEKILGSGDVKIQTYSSILRFDDIPNPKAVLQVLNDLHERALEEQQQQDDAELRQQITHAIGRTPAAVAKPYQLPQVKPPSRLFSRQNAASEHTATFRTHWVVLVPKIWRALIFFLLVALLLLYPLSIWGLWVQALFPFWLWLLGCSALLLVLGAIIWYQYEDWRNDVYRITEDKVIELQLTPLFGRVQQQSAGLDNIESVTYQQPTVLSRVLDYGDVTIQTGAQAGALVFPNIGNPVGVQQEIFRRLEVYRKEKERNERRRQNAELLRYVRTYDSVAHITPPDSAASV